MTVFFAYLFYFVAATLSPLQRRWLATNREAENGGQIDFAFKVMLIIAIFGSLLPIIEPFRLQGSPLTLSLLAVVCGVFGAGFWLCSYIAQKHVDAGVTALVSNIYTPVAILLGTFILGETLRGTQILGAALLLLAIVLISKKHHLGRFRFDKYFLMMLASGVCIGFLITAERALQKVTGFSAGTLISWWAQCVSLGIAVLVTKNKSRHTIGDTVVTGTVRFISALAWVLLVYLVGNLSVASAVSTFKVVIIFLAAAFFLREREDLPRKIVGSLIAVAGLLLMR